MATDEALRAALRANTARAPVIVTGSILAVGPSPGIWSGRFPVYQEVTYQPRHWKRLIPPRAPDLERLVVRHLLVAGSRTADPDHPRLRPDLFQVGAEMLLFLELIDGHWTCLGEDYGAVPVTDEVREVVDAALARRPKSS
jgi:hypothetical protein